MHCEAIKTGKSLLKKVESSHSHYKNCSKAVVERDKKLILMHKLMVEENLAQSNGKFNLNKSKDCEQDSLNNSSLGSPAQQCIDTLNPSEDYKSLVCPLCFNFIYKA